MTRVLFKFWINTPAGKFEFRRRSRYRWLMRHMKGAVPDRLIDLGTEAPSAVDVCRNFGWTAGADFRACGSVFVPLNVLDSDKQKGTIKYRCPRYDLTPVRLSSEPQNWANLCFTEIGGYFNRPMSKDQRIDRIRNSILSHAGLVKDSDAEETVHISIKSVSKESPQPMSKFSMEGKRGEVLHFENIQTLNAYLALTEQE